MRSRKTTWIALAATLAVAGCGGSSSQSGSTGKTASSDEATLPSTTQAPRKKVNGLHDSPVPILMYHVVNTPPAGAPYPDLYVPQSEFEAQMDALKSKGYTGVTLQQVYDYWEDGYELPKRPIVLSFDDGYLSHFTKALPVLQEHGWPGVLNLELVKTGQEGALSSRMVRALLKAGWELDSHTINHPDLTTVGASQLRDELVNSRKQLKRDYGVDANFFCYPAGRFDDTVVAAVRAAGYKGATTTQPGLAKPSDLYRMPRVRINGGTSPSALLAQIASS